MAPPVQRRRDVLRLATGVAMAAAMPSAAGARSTLPDQTIRLVGGFASGSATDLMLKIIAPKLESRIGRRVSVENKAGETGAHAGEALKRASNDGTTIGFLPSLSLAGRLLVKNYLFEPEKDVVPLTIAGTVQTAIAVSRKIEVRSLAEYAAWLKAGGPERARMGATAADAFLEAFGRLLSRELGARLEFVPYRNMLAVVSDLQDDRLPAAAGVAASFVERHRGGRLRLIASSGAKRLMSLRDLPTAAEQGFPNLEMDEWFAFFATAGMAPALLEEWNRHLVATLSDPAVAAELVQQGVDVEPSSQPDAVARVASYLDKWRERFKMLGMTTAN